MIQKHSSKIAIVHYIGLEEWGKFRQYVDDDAQRCHFIHEYEDILTDDEYQTNIQQVFENIERWKTHQIWQQEDNTIYVWYAHQQI